MCTREISIQAILFNLQRTDGATSRLEESKQKVHRNNKEVSKSHTEGEEVEPKRDVDQEETDTTSEQSNGQNCGRVECITQLSRNDVPCSIRSHENSVHLRKDEWVVASSFLQLLLDGGVTFSREVCHEVATKCDEEGPTVCVTES